MWARCGWRCQMDQSDPNRRSVPHSRRRFLQVGYSGLLGLGLPGLLAAREGASSDKRSGRARSVIVILLSGGLGQHDSFDMKPEAPEGMRGEFKPIATAVPGIRMCEHLPGLAARVGKLAIVRSMSHPEGNHLVAVHRVLTGQPSNPRGANDLDRVASRDDFPCYAAVLDRVRRRSDGVPSGVALPTRLVEGPLTWPGQDAGFLGPRHDPWQLRLDPNRPEARDDTLALPPGLDPGRLHRRRHLLVQGGASSAGDPFLDQQDAALALLCNGRVGQALDLDREDPRLVDRYGRHSFGQSLLIARRLVEVGVPIVQASMGIVQTWDTHVANFPRLRDSLLPPLDQAVSALLDDLDVRGLLRRNPGGDARRIRPYAADLATHSRRRPRPRPLAQSLPGGFRRRRRGGRPVNRQVRPAGRLPAFPQLRPPRLGRDDL